MPKNKRSRRRGNGRDDVYRSDVVEKADMHNERFEKYYKIQDIIPEDEWDRFLNAMREPLPTTFRVAGSRQAARLLNDTIKNIHAPHLAGVVFEGEPVAPPAQISWYPEGLAWQLNVPKKVLRKSPEFKKFHSFLVFETEVGNVSRQEAVSMLPPLFLEVEPHHRVIDMCAAPGSKTAQLLEALHAQDSITASSIPSGLLIANDSDHKRTHLLIHQSARLPSPALMVTNQDASIYPIIKIPGEQVVFPSTNKPRVAAKKQYQLLFDRILCDVPCSGDGTMRKNVGIWKHWQPMDGNGLHSLQVRILQRAMRMLKRGGRIVYSTCSLNPVENEAVITAALKSMPEFELIDMSNHLPGLIHRPGLTTWRPTVDRSIAADFATYDDYMRSLPESKRAESKMVPSHWPPSTEDAEKFHLTRCIRIYPHLQDTGGFFIAVLQKKPPTTSPNLPSPTKVPSEGKRQAEAAQALESSEVKKPRLAEEPQPSVEVEDFDVEETVDEVAEDAAIDTVPSASVESTEVLVAKATNQKNKRKGQSDDGGGTHFKENPYTFIAPDDPIVQSCISTFNLTSDFPASNILVRNPEGEPVRSMYMANDIVKSIVQNNDYARIRLMTCGTKVFGKQEGAETKRDGAESHFRVLSEGLPVILPYIGPNTIITADVAMLKVLMESYYPLFTSFPDEFRTTIESKNNGSYVVRFQPGRVGDAVLNHELVLPIWRSNKSLTLMIDKKSKSALSLRLFGEDITTVARENEQKKQGKDSEMAADAPIIDDTEVAVRASDTPASHSPSEHPEV